MPTLSDVVNTFGIFLGIVGTIIGFFHGFPQPTFDEPPKERLNVLLADAPSPDPDYDDKVRAIRKDKAKHNFLAKFALALLSASFVIQLIAVWL